MALMNLNMKGPAVSPETIQRQQGSHGDASLEQQALTAQLAQLPGYQQHIETLMKGSSLLDRMKSYQAIMSQAQAAGVQIPEDMKLDMFGAVRDKTWAENHPKLFMTLMVAGSLAGLAAGGAAAGAFSGAGAAGGAGATLGPTTAGSLAGTTAATAGSTVPARLAAAAPTVTGGSTLSTALPLIQLGAKTAGGFLQDKSDNALKSRQLDIQERGQNQNFATTNANFARQNPGQQMNNAVRGDLLANMQPATFSGSGRDLKLSGGLNPGLLSQDSRSLGALQARQALLAAMGQEPDKGMPDPYGLPSKRLG